MQKRILRMTLAVLAAAVLTVTSGCAAAGGQSAGSGASSVTQPQSSAPGASTGVNETDGDRTVYDCGGLRIGIPSQYLNQLIVKTDLTSSDAPAFGTRLILVSEKASVEAYRADTGEDGMGFLFSIEKLDQAGYEQYLCSGRDGREAFATDGGNYYIYTTPTDVQFYRSGGQLDLNSPDWKSWESLQELGDAVRTDMMTRNKLTTYSDNEFFSREYTYDGGHSYVKYYPYQSVDGTTQEYDILILSQPVRQGQGGIWCVERFYDEYGNLYPYFPGTDIMGSDDVTAEEYYAGVQKACDAGSRSDVLTPLGAAKWFAIHSGYYGVAPTDGSFQETDGLDTDYINTNKEILDYIPALLSGEKVDSMDLLSCMGGFTVDNWGVLGRSYYGSDWWPPLLAALKSAAVGDSQELRDRDMIHLYLSYSKTDGPIAEGLPEILRIQVKADGNAFEQALADFTAAQQESVRGVLNSPVG